MSWNSYFKLNNTSAKNFGLNFPTKSWLTLKKKKKIELLSPCTLLVSGVVQLSEHEVRKPVPLRSLHAEKEGDVLFCWNKGGGSFIWEVWGSSSEK